MLHSLVNKLIACGLLTLTLTACSSKDDEDVAATPSGKPATPVGATAANPGAQATPTGQAATPAQAPIGVGGQATTSLRPDPATLPTALPSGMPSTLPSGLATAMPSGFPTVLPTVMPTAIQIPTSIPLPPIPTTTPPKK